MAAETKLYVVPGSAMPTKPEGLSRRVKLEVVRQGIELEFARRAGESDGFDFDDEYLLSQNSNSGKPPLVKDFVRTDLWVATYAYLGFAGNDVRIREWDDDLRRYLMSSDNVYLIQNGRIDWNFRFCKTCKAIYGVEMRKDPNNKRPRQGDYWYHCYHCGSWWKRRLDYKAG